MGEFFDVFGGYIVVGVIIAFVVFGMVRIGKIKRVVLPPKKVTWVVPTKDQDPMEGEVPTEDQST
jgi:Na+/pantothenate symporter